MLWHVTERILRPGDEIAPGRYGSILREHGLQHPFFTRELILEQCREHLGITVSRLECSYAFDDLQTAATYVKSKKDESIFEVEPIDLGAPNLRLDILWLTWMGEPGRTEAQQRALAGAYWRGESTMDRKLDAQSTWEILLPCGLRILDRVS